MMLVVGLSHRTAPIEVRERLAVGAEATSGVLARLAARPEILEAMFLSTCNRVEVVARAAEGRTIEEVRAAIVDELGRQAGADRRDELAVHLYDKRGDDAVRHVFRVAASLDSMVLGEPQILGQVKDAYDAAVAAGTLRTTLARCVSRAFAVAKRVRTETSIGAGSVSVSSVAVDLARRVFGDLNERAVLLLGAGEMAEAAARTLAKEARSLRVCNRSFDRAAALARDMHASAVPWEQLADELVPADVVVAGTASLSHVVTVDMVKRAMKARKGRTLLFIDIAVPRNVQPAVHAIGNVYVFNVDDLEQEVARGLKARHGQVEAGERIVTEELARFLEWRRGLEVQPTIVGLRAKTRAVLSAELERSLGGRLKHLSESDRDALRQMIESAASKLLHTPTTRLKARAAGGDDPGDLTAAIRHLYDLQEVGPPLTEPGGDPETRADRRSESGGEEIVTH